MNPGTTRLGCRSRSVLGFRGEEEEEATTVDEARAGLARACLGMGPQFLGQV